MTPQKPHGAPGLELRPPEFAELEAVLRLAAGITDDLYGRLSPSLHAALSRDPAAVIGGPDYWRSATVAVAGAGVVAVCRTEAGRVTDLWLAEGWRRQGLGSRLLADAEDGIRLAGHAQAHLNVVRDNTPAIRFYRQAGWAPDAGYRNEKWGLEMLRMFKGLA